MTRSTLLSGLFVLSCAPLIAQGTGADMTGTLTEPSGDFVPGATITITNTQTNAQRSLVPTCNSTLLPTHSQPAVQNRDARPAGERGLSAFNFGKRWTTSFLYQLPFGKGHAFLGNANRLLDAVVGGWQVGGIYTLEAGFPFSVGCSSNSTYQNTDTTCRADATGLNPALDNATPNAGLTWARSQIAWDLWRARALIDTAPAGVMW
jgi:hypothetical protein